ncbi:hypothetical protein BUALT_Bualt01G0154900 [Buddleja alternifolia]|uniref:60S acidic ribosomal protein P2 n=1 Tax=Buddleja alternifolia TaxID=168488 RepID=A0AAV6YHT0_9LAMI|nr:hypothetical protein BUALT_Bualt01G0154900 [Buddleja alternifolia]
MKVIAAYLLAVLGGKTFPSAEDLKHILALVGPEANDDKIKKKLASVPVGGAGVAIAAPVGGAGGDTPATTAESKKEEKVEEKEESEDDMGFSLFD